MVDVSNSGFNPLADTISLEPEVQENKISLGIPEISDRRSEEGIQERVKEAKFADPQMDTTILESSFRNAEDEAINEIFANKDMAREAEARKQVIDELSVNPSEDAFTIVEGFDTAREPDRRNSVAKAYGRQLANTTAVTSETLQDVMEEAPEVGDETMDAIEEFSAKSSIIRDIIQKTAHKFQEKSLLGKIGSVGATFIPFASWIARNDAVDNAPTVSWLPGNNVKEQIEHIWSLPIEEIGPTFQEAIDDIALFSDFEAMLFAQAFQTYSNSDAFWDNAFGVAEVGSIVPFAAGVRIAKGVSKAATKYGPNTKKIANAVGDTVKSATDSVAKKNILEGIDNAEQIEDILPTLMNPDSIFDDAKNLSNAAVRKLKDQATVRATEGTRLLENGIDINALDEAERIVLAQKEFEHIKKVHTHVQDSILDTQTIRAEDTPTNVDMVQVEFGKMDGDTFKSDKAARTWANRYLQFKDFEVVPHGEGYTIQVQKPIKLGDRLESLKLATENNSPDRYMWARLLYSDGYKLAMQSIKDRRTVSDLSENLGRIVEHIGEPLTKVGSKKRLNELTDVLESIRDKIHPDGKRKWLDIGEFEDEFKRIHDKFPTEAQVDSYVASRQLSDLDYALRDLVAMKTKQRIGVENWEVKGIEKQFEGIVQDTLPFSSKDFFRAVAVDENGKILKVGTNTMGANKRKEFQDLIDDGWTIVKPFEGFVDVSDEAATFVLTRTGKRSQIMFGQSVGYNPGGHLITKSPLFIKQPDIKITKAGTKLYRGDKTVSNVYSEKQGAEVVAHLEQARLLKVNGNSKGLKKYLRDNIPEMTLKQFHKYNPNVPFSVTRSGVRTVDTSALKQGVDYDHSLVGSAFDERGKLSGKFMGERDDTVVDALVSERNADIRIEQAKLIKPLEALQIGLRDAVDQRVMTDYISKSADRYVREFGDILDVDLNQIRRNPVAVLTNPKFKEGVPVEAIVKAKDVAQAINHFIGTPTPTSKIINRFKDRIVQHAFDNLDKDGKAFKIVDERLLHTVNDPATFFRGVAFHFKMGLFNVKQLFLQAQILSQVAAVGGVRDSLASVPAFMYSHGLRLTTKPQMLEEAGKRMSKFGWKAEEFTESHKAMVNSGWDIIGGSVAWRDMYEGPRLLKRGKDKFLDTGLYPFKKGEQIGRITAWHTAYRNWRKANPKAKFDREAIETVRLRASDLTANMTRDMNAIWQRGFFSVPTQFWGFQARVFEQMVSPASRLTGMERARLFGGISLLYGVPVGFGAASFAIPFDEQVKKWIIENGLKDQVDENMFAESLRDGIISTGLEMMSGMDFDTAPFGPAGNPFFKDVLRQDKSWYEIFGGASAGIIVDTVGHTLPFMSGIYYSVINGDPEKDIFALNSNMVFDFLKQVSSVNNTRKLWKALNTGKWITNNENVMGDISALEAFTSAVTGMELEKFSDTFLRNEIIKDTKAEVREGQTEAQKEYQRARRAADAGDRDQFLYHIQRAKMFGIVYGLNEREQSTAFDRGFLPENMEDSVIDFYNDFVLERQRIKEAK